LASAFTHRGAWIRCGHGRKIGGLGQGWTSSSIVVSRGVKEGIFKHALSDFGVPARLDFAPNLISLAGKIETGKGVIVGLNAGILWNDSSAYDNGMANHAVVVTGVARDPRDHHILGFYINDSGPDPAYSARFVDAVTMDAAFIQSGSRCVVTEGSRY
jgi:hypothetical protein